MNKSLSDRNIPEHKSWIKSVSWEYSYVEEYLEEFDIRKILKCSFLLAVLPRNRLDPKSFGNFYIIKLPDLEH